MHVAVPAAALRLRQARFDLITRILGCESDTARAELIGMSARTIDRARRGMFGVDFIANTYAAFKRHEDTLAQLNITVSLDDLFEVADAAVEAVAA